MRRFGADNIMNMMDRLGMEEDMPIESRLVTRAVESAQKRVEGSNFDARKGVLQYDDVMNQQRLVVYKQRKDILEQENLSDVALNMIYSVLERAVEQRAQRRGTGGLGPASIGRCGEQRLPAR